MVPTATAIMNVLAWSSQLVNTVIISARTRSGTVPIQYLLHNMALGIQRTRAEQPHLPAFQRDTRKHEPGRYRRQYESGQTQVQKRNHGDQPERHLLSGVKRQRLDVEEIHQEQHRQQNKLAPLGVVAEKETQILEDELPLRRRDRAQDPGHRPPDHPAELPFGAFLRLGEAEMVQPPVQQRSQNHRERCCQPELGDGPRIRYPEQPVHDDGCRPLAGQQWTGRGAEHREIVHQVFEAFRLGQSFGPEKAEDHQHDYYRRPLPPDLEAPWSAGQGRCSPE